MVHGALTLLAPLTSVSVAFFEIQKAAACQGDDVPTVVRRGTEERAHSDEENADGADANEKRLRKTGLASKGQRRRERHAHEGTRVEHLLQREGD